MQRVVPLAMHVHVAKETIALSRYFSTPSVCTCEHVSPSGFLRCPGCYCFLVTGRWVLKPGDVKILKTYRVPKVEFDAVGQSLAARVAVAALASAATGQEGSAETATAPSKVWESLEGRKINFGDSEWQRARKVLTSVLKQGHEWVAWCEADGQEAIAKRSTLAGRFIS